MKKGYLLVFDRENFNTLNLHAFIQNWSSISNWWHYIQSCYILLSYHSLASLSEEFRNKFPNKRFLLIEVDLKNNNGWLPEAAWQWIRNNA